MITVKAKDIKGLKDGTITTSAYAEKLVKGYSAYEIALALAEFISVNDVVKNVTQIPVTTEELNEIINLFRIKGSSPRGRKRKDSK